MVRERAAIPVMFLVFWAGRPLGGSDDAKAGGEQAQAVAEAELAALSDGYLAKYKPLYLRSQQALWEANTTGTDEAFARHRDAENALVELHSDRATFAALKKLKDGGAIADSRLKRELDVLYRTFLRGQADAQLQKKIVALETEVEQIFNTHRSVVDGQSLSENDVRQILSQTTDSTAAEKAWKAYMEVGTKVAQKLHELVRLRNQQAREVGFANYYAMQLALSEIEEPELMRLFDELEALTREPFTELKREIDAAMAARFGLSISQLRPWHFGDLFFQEVPPLQGVNLDEVYKDKDLLGLAKDYYKSMGLEVEDILNRSDLYEKPGKCPHAFAADLDRSGDVRVLCNLRPNVYWMDTLLHELGHAVYDKYIGSDVPFVLHRVSHGLTTEGYAIAMGAMAKNEEFLIKVARVPAQEGQTLAQSARRSLRAERLIFARWAQVMVRFEQAMYADPDQDLGKLWWDLKCKYQLLNPPETVNRPDYAAKVHVVTVPAYYHSYMLGELFGCQLRHHVAARVLGLSDPGKTSFYGRPEVGAYLREKVFGPGDLYSWNELTKLATGEPLSARYFAEQCARQ